MVHQLVSVIIPCFNAENTIHRCISSLINQTYSNIEIIAVNDGSTDRTYGELQKTVENYDKLILINQPNSGISSARNAGIHVARGEYYAFVDADDYIEPTFLEKMVACIEDADISICRYTSDSVVSYYTHYDFTVEDVIKEMMVPQENIAAFVWNRLYKASIIQEHSLAFDEKVFTCEDTLFNYIYMQYVKKVGVCDETLYHYVINPFSMMFSKAFNPKKISANRAFNYMLTDSSNKQYAQWVQIAAMWYNLILKRQLYRNRYKPNNDEIETINRMLGLNYRAFLKAPIPLRYKIALPIWKMR